MRTCVYATDALATSVIACALLKKRVIMFVPEKMKCNRLVQVDIPKGHDMYSRASCLVLPPASEYTGEIPASSRLNKLDELADFDRFDNMRQREELSKQNESKDSE